MKEEERKQTERRYQVTIVAEKPAEFIKVKVDGTLNVYQVTNYMIQ